ncbi:MAG: hypothetical protein M5U25_16625 [Planctomycetota bacterium]|nr:hypothetical protein [Planctomycetota bacterium]
MHVERLRELLHSFPFKPLLIELVNDQSVEVPHPDFARILDDNRTCVVDREGGIAVFIDIPLIQAVFQYPLAKGDA